MVSAGFNPAFRSPAHPFKLKAVSNGTANSTKRVIIRRPNSFLSWNLLLMRCVFASRRKVRFRIQTDPGSSGFPPPFGPRKIALFVIAEFKVTLEGVANCFGDAAWKVDVCGRDDD